MADPLVPHDLAMIEHLAAAGLWQQAGLLEARRIEEGLTKQEILDGLAALRRSHPEVTVPQEPVPDLSHLTEIERELIEDVLTLFDEQGLSREQTLSLMGQLSVLIELVKQGQAQSNSQ